MTTLDRDLVDLICAKRFGVDTWEDADEDARTSMRGSISPTIRAALDVMADDLAERVNDLIDAVQTERERIAVTWPMHQMYVSKMEGLRMVLDMIDRNPRRPLEE